VCIHAVENKVSKDKSARSRFGCTAHEVRAPGRRASAGRTPAFMPFGYSCRIPSGFSRQNLWCSARQTGVKRRYCVTLVKYLKIHVVSNALFILFL
jgi:hypothetical protein